MHTLGFRTHVLLALAAAVGVIAALGRPWYAPAPVSAGDAGAAAIGDLRGPVEGLTAAIARWATENSGATGWDALGDWGLAVALFAAVTAAGALGCLVPALQGVAREALRYGGLGCLALVAWKLVDTPGPNAALELRNGAFVAAAAALLAFTSGSAVASAPPQRRTPGA